MTPQEKAVIEAAMALYHGVQGGEDPVALDHDLTQAVECLIFYCEECNAGGHTCPGDGNPIGHTATNCGEHQDDMPDTVTTPLAPELVTPVNATMTIPGVMTDVPISHIATGPGPVESWAQKEAARQVGEAAAVAQVGEAADTVIEQADDPIWVETTMANCLINDRIRIGAEETTVLRSNRGIWNVASRQAGWQDGAGNWRPEYVKGAAPWFPADRHVELRMELEAVPGFKQYPAGASIELLCTPERLAVLRMQEGFPGSAITSSHVD